MPTYDYSCDACDHKFEVFEPISATPQKKCPKCKRNKLRRLFGAGAALVFKGSGFYQTDYRSDSYKSAAAAEKPADSSKDSGDKAKTESKTESKPDAKTESKPESKPTKPGKSKES